MKPLIYDTDALARVFRAVNTIAVVGASAKPNRPSHAIMKYMQDKGFRVIPVNPGQAGKNILGVPVYAALADIPGPVDLVNIFRPSEATGPIVDEVIRLQAEKNIGTVWMQLRIRNDEAAARAATAGLSVIMDRCIKVEYARLFGTTARSDITANENANPEMAANP